MKKESNVASPSSTFAFEINTASQNNQWVLDTGYGSHMYSYAGLKKQ